MSKAFVFGKFLPFHKGHEAMIHFALSKCDLLTVLVCCSDTESIPAKTRQKWIEQTFRDDNKIKVKIFNYLERELPNTSESSLEVSKIWSAKFKKLFPDYDLVITSEAYGNYVADFMKIDHITFDNLREIIPVSATDIRSDLFKYWDYLPNSVKPYFAIKVVILGTESTGKTTLSEKLAAHFNCSIVQEVGREIIDNSNDFSFEDLARIAGEHANNIKNAVLDKCPLVIIDTDIHITKSYGNFIFNRELNVEVECYNANKADLYLYLNNDVEFVQDGTRLSENDRNLLEISHRAVLRKNNIELKEITGNWEQRFGKALDCIVKLIQEKMIRE